VIVLDAYALVAMLADEPAAAHVKKLLLEEECAISTLNLAEAADVLHRTRGVTTTETRNVVGMLAPGAMTLVDVDERCAWRAAALRTVHYRRRSSELSLADCVLLATAEPGRDSVATSDAPVLRAARREGLGAISLPDAGGRMVTGFSRSPGLERRP